MTDSKPPAQHLRAAALVFGVLGKCLYREPTTEELNQLLEARVLDDVPFGKTQEDTKRGTAELRQWASEQADGLSQAALDEIKHDFLYLFAGVGHPLASPWESTYFNESRQMFEKQTLEVRAWYQRFGLMIERKNREPDDNIGYELGFVAHLAERAAEALEAGNDGSSQALLDALQVFLVEHPLRWVFVWTSRVLAQARSRFYRGLALLVGGSLQALAEEFGLGSDAV